MKQEEAVVLKGNLKQSDDEQDERGSLASLRLVVVLMSIQQGGKERKKGSLRAEQIGKPR